MHRYNQTLKEIRAEGALPPSGNTFHALTTINITGSRARLQPIRLGDVPDRYVLRNPSSADHAHAEE